LDFSIGPFHNRPTRKIKIKRSAPCCIWSVRFFPAIHCGQIKAI
jgi:hypothetical protein